MFGIFKRVAKLEARIAELEDQLDDIDFNNGFLAMADRIADEAREVIAKAEKAAPKKRCRPRKTK